MLEGHKKNTPINLKNIILKKWMDLGQSRIHWVAFHNVTRKKDDNLLSAVFHASYIAKTATKGNVTNYTKDFATSRLKPANDKDINNILKLA